jgi:psiF repeat
LKRRPQDFRNGTMDGTVRDPNVVHIRGTFMHKLMLIAVAYTFAVAAPAIAADAAAPAAAPNAQQEKMKACNVKAEGKTGEDRKAFMKTCLSATPAPAASPESKMAMCNKQTAGMAKEARSKAQSECMKAPAKGS